MTLYNFVPHRMTMEKRWGQWRSEVVKGRPTKVPWVLDGSRRADSTRPADWGDWSKACAHLIRMKDADGLAFRLGEGWSGVDLDHCLDPETGIFEPWAEDIIHRLDSYSEVSPSGTGVKIFLRGTLPGTRRRKGQIEMYDKDRYFTVTGDRLNGVSPDVEERDTELEILHLEIFGDGAEPDLRRGAERLAPSPASQEERIVSLAQKAKNGASFSRLWNGDTSAYSSASEADLALCSHLAFYSVGDPTLVDRLFRSSGLFREKWDEKHGGQTYGAMTIAKALSEMSDFYKPVAGKRFRGAVGI